MSIELIVAAAQADGAALAEARMTSTATVHRRTGRQAQNEDTGEEFPEWEVVYTGPFRLKGKGSRTVTIAGIEYEQATAEGHFVAVDAETGEPIPLADNDYIDITAGEWAGTVLSIVEAVKGDQRTARRVPVVEVARPEEWV